MNLDDFLCALAPGESLCVGDAFQGISIFGGVGSGKTTGSGRTLAMAMLERGWGGLVLTAKTDEAEQWTDYCARAGRSEDLVVMMPGGPNRLNFAAYEFEHFGAEHAFTPELVSLIQTAMEGGQEPRASRDPFWDHATAQMLGNGIDLVTIAQQRLDLVTLVAALRSAPKSRVEAAAQANDASPEAQSSILAKLFRQAHQRDLPAARRQDLAETRHYWFQEYPGMDPKTRANIESALMVRLAGLLRSPYRDLFSTYTTVTPDSSFGGKVIVLDIPVSQFGEVGRFAQVLFKTIWQRAAERRGLAGVPVFLWADEAHHFASRRDTLFQLMARSSRVAMVFLTQSVANYRATLGDRSNTSNAAESLLSNFQTMIFHANGCPSTNEFAERVFGHDFQPIASPTVHPDTGLQLGLSPGLHPVLPSARFTQLRKGGVGNGGIVEGYAFHAGRRWITNRGRNWILARFKQEFSLPSQTRAVVPAAVASSA